jgi:hypothetical protein
MQIAIVETEGICLVILFLRLPPQHFCYLFPDCLRVFLDRLAFRECVAVGLSEQRNDEVLPFHDGTMFRE